MHDLQNINWPSLIGLRRLIVHVYSFLAHLIGETWYLASWWNHLGDMGKVEFPRFLTSDTLATGCYYITMLILLVCQKTYFALIWQELHTCWNRCLCKFLIRDSKLRKKQTKKQTKTNLSIWIQSYELFIEMIRFYADVIVIVYVSRKAVFLQIDSLKPW